MDALGGFWGKTMTYTPKTFCRAAKNTFIKGIYGYTIFSLLCLYWVYSTERILNQSIKLGSTPFEMIMVTGCYAIIVTSALLVIYFNTKDDVVDWIKR